MIKTGKREFILGLALTIATFLLDQASKALFLSVVAAPGQPPLEIAPFFNLVMVWNTGISFGMLAGRHQTILLIAASIVIIFILLTWLYKNTSRLTACGLGFVIGGATANVIDRFRFGAVADFFDFHIGQYHWPAFNIADSGIFIGVVLLCAGGMFTPKHQKKKEARHEI